MLSVTTYRDVHTHMHSYVAVCEEQISTKKRDYENFPYRKNIFDINFKN